MLSLNQASVEYLSPLDEERLVQLASESCQFRVAEQGEEVIGFILALAKGAQYSSVNYRWFATRYQHFVYIDRVVVRSDCRGLGLARQFYEALEAWARQHTMVRLTCEVDVVPPNVASLAFHDKAGFKEVGQQVVAGQSGDRGKGEKVVALYAKVLESLKAPGEKDALLYE
ncbi:GNAT family N-acetyltransferase [Candidatus Entotheonella serta]|nr:GNAT family N-acetyltransferase [Candidatus Entotheonella serta]